MFQRHDSRRRGRGRPCCPTQGGRAKAARKGPVSVLVEKLEVAFAALADVLL